MTLGEFFQYLTWSLYVLIFVIATVRAVRRPVRANIDIAILFSLPAILIGLSLERIFHFINIQPGPLVNAISAALILAMAYMLLRLVDDFSYVPRWVMRSSEIALALLVIATTIFTYNPPLPLWLAPLLNSVYCGTACVHRSGLCPRVAPDERGYDAEDERGRHWVYIVMCSIRSCRAGQALPGGE